MIIAKVEARSFRNIVNSQFEPGQQLNFLFGANAQGKTNWLEVIHFLATGDSFRTARPSEAIAFGHTEAILRSKVNQLGIDKVLAIQLGSNTKGTYLNGKREPSSRYAGHLVVFICAMDQMTTIRAEPEYRRRFIDQGAISIDPKYARVLETYQRILKQKNRLLRQLSEEPPTTKLIEQVEIWNQQLVEYATLIHQTRSSYVRRLQEALHGHLFGQEEIAIRYASALEKHGDLSDYARLLAERLKVRLPAEIAVGYSLVGPHRDDLEIVFDGQEVRRFASAGQQRSALLILDLARISVYNKASDEYPVFLVDDIDAELDRDRIGVLLDHLRNKTQTFITTSKSEIARAYSGRAALFRIEQGQIVA